MYDMRMKDVDERKKYVQMIRSSFENGESAGWEQDVDARGEAGNGFSFFKIRLLFALFLFTIYVVCDQMDTKIYQYSTKDIAEIIEVNYDYANVEKYVMMLMKNE